MNKVLKIREIASQIRLPLRNIFTQKEFTDFWILVTSDSLTPKVHSSRVLYEYEDEEGYNKDLEDDTEAYSTTFVAYDNTHL